MSIRGFQLSGAVGETQIEVTTELFGATRTTLVFQGDLKQDERLTTGMWTPQGEQQQAAVGEISGAANKEERSRLEQNKLHNKTVEAVFNPRVLMHRLDVQQMLLVKDDAPKDQSPGVDLQDPKPFHIKEEQEEVCTSLEVEQLHRRETNVIRFPVLDSPIKSEDDEESPLFSKLCQPIKVDRYFPEKDGGESTRNQDRGDTTNSSGTEVIEDDEEGDDADYPGFQLKHLLNTQPEAKVMDNDHEEQMAPETGGNNGNKSFGYSELAKIFVSHRSKSSLKCSCDDYGETFNGSKPLNSHQKIHTGEKPFCCDICEHRHNQKNYLNEHMRTHT
ncbi:hypothetical protein ILYODFUR_011491, partial [Ilyodon furcidens]